MSSTNTVLVIDDSQTVRNLVESRLAGVADHIVRAIGGEEGIRLARISHPSVILLDMNLPDIDGVEVCRRLKGDERTRDIPVLFLTVERDPAQLERAFAEGGLDYITKPFEQIELRARVRSAMRIRQMIDTLNNRARVDPLTELENRGAFDRAVDQALDRRQRLGKSVWLLMIDLDHFKNINDTYGHRFGDDVLQASARAIARVVGRAGGCYRYGGEEMAVLLQVADDHRAEALGLQLLASIRSVKLPHQDQLVQVTASLGMAGVGVDCVSTAKQLVESADAALYHAKQTGRNRLVVRRLGDQSLQTLD